MLVRITLACFIKCLCVISAVTAATLSSTLAIRNGSRVLFQGGKSQSANSSSSSSLNHLGSVSAINSDSEDSGYNVIFSDEFSIESSSRLLQQQPNSNSNENRLASENKTFFDLNSIFSNEQEFLQGSSGQDDELNESSDEANRRRQELLSSAMGDGGGGDGGAQEQIYSVPAKIILSSLAITASLITVCGNLLVMTSFFLDRQIRNPTNYFLLSLAFSDFFIGLFSIPFLTLYLMLGRWPFGQVICNLWLSLDYTVCLTSIYTVLFITIDRFCSVKIPAKYRKWRTPNKIIIMVLLTWFIPILLFFTSIFGWSYGSQATFDPKYCDVAWANNKVFSVALIVSYFWSTLCVIVVLYVFIYQVARGLERKSREKQRKLSSLVGASAHNTGALVSVVALAVNHKMPNNQTGGGGGGGAKSNLGGGRGGEGGGGKSFMLRAKSNYRVSDDALTPDDDDDDDTAANSRAASITKFGKALLGKGKGKSKKKDAEAMNSSAASSTAKGGAGMGAGGAKKYVSSNSSINNNSSNNNNSNNNKNKNTNQDSSSLMMVTTTSMQESNSTTIGGAAATNNEHSPLKGGKAGASPSRQVSRTISNTYSTNTNDDMSSSYESHSDFDTAATNRRPLLAKAQPSVKTNTLGIEASGMPIKLKQELQQVAAAAEASQPVSSERRESSVSRATAAKDLPKPQPRPESLALMSHDLLTEKCEKKSHNATTAEKPPVEAAAVENNLPAASTTTIPFIDDEFEDLSYVLHRRQFMRGKCTDREQSKVPVKEETIVIKTPLGFFQRIATPIRSSFSSRRNSVNAKASAAPAATVSAAAAAQSPPLATMQQQQRQQALVVFSSTGPSSVERPLMMSAALASSAVESSVNAKPNNGVADSRNSSSSKPPEYSNKLNISTNNNNNTTYLKITPSSTLTALTASSANNSPKPRKSTADEKPLLDEATNNYKNNLNTRNNKATNTMSSVTSVMMNSSVNMANRPQMANKRKKPHENRARKALRTITFILGAFIFCFAPWHVVSIYNSFCSPNCWNSRLYHHFFYSCYFLCYLNSPINPFMYALANQQFKKTFCRILKGDLRKL